MAEQFQDVESFDWQEFNEKIFLKHGTRSNALNRGVKTGAFERVKRGVYKVVDWWRKVIGTLYYWGGKPWIYTAWTFEENNIHRKEWLKGKLEIALTDLSSPEETSDKFSKPKGYESKTVGNKDVDETALYENDEFDYSKVLAK